MPEAILMTFDRIKRRWRALFRRDELEQELADELRFHLERDAAQNIRNGMNEEDARYAALKSFGGVEQAKEECRDARGMRFIENLLQDLRYGARSLRKNPGFTAVVVLTLALGIGANTALFSVVNGVLLNPLPYPQSDRLVTLWERTAERGIDQERVSGPNYLDWRAQNSVFSEMAVSPGWDRS